MLVFSTFLISDLQPRLAMHLCIGFSQDSAGAELGHGVGHLCLSGLLTKL